MHNEVLEQSDALTAANLMAPSLLPFDFLFLRKASEEMQTSFQGICTSRQRLQQPGLREKILHVKNRFKCMGEMVPQL